MLLLVDGYNVTMRDPATAGRTKEDQRELLVSRLRAHAQRLAPGGEVVVVFDARDSLGRVSGEERPVRVIFASDADDEIVRRCLLSKGRIVVVTDDLRLRARISQDVGRHVEYRDGASVSGEALAATNGRPKRGVPRDVGLPRGANTITRELKDLWLDDDE